MKPRSLVFDLFGSYLRYRGGAVALRELIELMTRFGVGASTARVVMSRLRKEGWFETRPGADGRSVVYALTDRSWRMLDEGRDRIWADPELSWDGWWRMVIYFVPESARATRETLRKELSWLGFGPLAASTWMSPRDRLKQVEEKFAGEESVRLDLLQAHSKGRNEDRDIAKRCWDLAALNADYSAFLGRHRQELPRIRSGRLQPEQALVASMELIQDWRRFPFRDPGLPTELLPAHWHGHDAQRLFTEAAALLRPLAEQAVDEVVSAPSVTP